MGNITHEDTLETDENTRIPVEEEVLWFMLDHKSTDLPSNELSTDGMLDVRSRSEQATEWLDQ